jgi:hypothetical protein
LIILHNKHPSILPQNSKAVEQTLKNSKEQKPTEQKPTEQKPTGTAIP